MLSTEDTIAGTALSLERFDPARVVGYDGQMSRVALALAVALLACAAKDRACSESPVRVSYRLEAANLCLLNGARLAVHALIPIHYTTSKLGDFDARAFYELDCSLADRDCSGVKFDLEAVDKGEPIGFMDIGSLRGASVVSQTADVVTIEWGIHTFTVDLARGTVSFAEGSDSSDSRGRGQVGCKVNRGRP